MAGVPTAASVAASAVGLIPEAINMFGFIESECVCRVTGNPQSKKKDLYFLACAIAFGKVPRLGPTFGFVPAPGLIALNENVTGREVEFTLQYRTSTAVAMTTAALKGDDTTAMYNRLEVLSGPKESVIGGDFNFTGPGFGFPIGAGPPGGPPPAKGFALVPKLPWTGKTLLTTNDTAPDPVAALGAADTPTKNPRPVGDYRSRGTLISMVYTALSMPGSSTAMTYPRPTVVTRFIGG